MPCFFTVKRPQPGPSEDFQPIRDRPLNKEMNVRTSRETVIFFFDWLVSILNFWPCSKTLRVFFYTAEMQRLLILLLQREIILDLDLKSSVARQKRKKSPVVGNACVSEKNHPVKQPGCYYVNKTSIQISLFGYTLFQTLSTCRGCNSRIVLVFIPKLLAQNKKRFVSISVEMFL